MMVDVFTKPWVSFVLKYGPRAAYGVKAYFLRSKNIILLGHTGVGKTAVLDEILQPTLNKPPATNPTIEPEEVTIDIGGRKVGAVDTPGHPVLFQEFAENELERLISGDFKGIVLVVSFGYTQPQGTYFETERSSNPSILDGAVNPSYLEEQREEEFKFLEGWISQIERFGRRGSKLQWIVVALNKCEVLMKEGVLADAEDYYGPNGKFGKRLHTIVEPRNIHLHKVAAVPGKFFDLDIDYSDLHSVLNGLNDNLRGRLERLL